MSADASNNIQELIHKYMNYMDFIKSSSKLTLKHYMLDLQQAFLEPNKSKSNIRDFSPSEDDLLSLARQAQSRWGRLSLASRNRKAATIKSFFKWLYQEGIIQIDLNQKIKCPKVSKKLPHYISVDEALAILSYMENQKNNVPLTTQALFYLLYGGGLRISEACALKWENINSNNRSLIIKGKGNKERIIIIPHKAIQCISLLKNGNSKFVLGESLNVRTAYELIRQLGKKVGLLHPLHPHALRHSFATHILSSGGNLRTLQEMLGHESLQATEKYTHLGIDQLARTLEKCHPLGTNK